MYKTYVTFGQAHVHEIGGDVFDKDCVAVIDCDSAKDGRDKAFEFFDRKFCFSYFGEEFNHDNMKYFPRGFVNV